MPLKQSPPCQKLLQEEERSWTTCRSLRARPRTPVRPSERPSGSPSKSSPGNPSWVTAHKPMHQTSPKPHNSHSLHGLRFTPCIANWFTFVHPDLFVSPLALDPPHLPSHLPAALSWCLQVCFNTSGRVKVVGIHNLVAISNFDNQ